LDLTHRELLLSFFCDLGSNSLNKKHLKLIEKYEKIIESVVRSKIRDPIEQQDACQYIKIQIIKSYKNRYKYGKGGKDWGNVVRSIIRRRAGDHRNKLSKINSRLYLASNLVRQYPGGTDVRSWEDADRVLESINIEHTIEKSKSPYEVVNKNDFIEKVKEIILNDPIDTFSDWEKEYVEIVYELYNLEEDIDENSIMECMGYSIENRNEFRNNVKSFISKAKELKIK